MTIAHSLMLHTVLNNNNNVVLHSTLHHTVSTANNDIIALIVLIGSLLFLGTLHIINLIT